MPTDSLKRICTLMTLGLLTVSAFFIRLESFKSSYPRASIDEVVYYRMAMQVKENFFDYNTIPYARELISRGRELPGYFTKPLYKYPPLFTMMLAQSMNIFGNSMLSAVYVPLLSGVLLIPLIFFMGSMLFNRTVGLVAAFFLYMDPVSIVCSQKVWVESSLTFFLFLSVWAFAKGFKSTDGLFFVLGGIFCGLAANVKPPGLFILPPLFAYAWFYRQDLLKNGWFWAGLFMPAMMLIPWILWNVAVYGENFLAVQVGTHTFGVHTTALVPRVIAVAVLAVVLGVYFWRRRHQPAAVSTELQKSIRRIFWKAVIALAIIAEASSLWQAFHPFSLPRAGWQSGMFADELPTFYFGQLMEFSAVYLLGFASYIFLRQEITPEERLLQYVAMGNLLLYVVWGNFQSRYILGSLPFFLLLSAHFLYRLTQRMSAPGPAALRGAQWVGLILFLAYAVAKTFHINAAISFTNNLCYF